MGYRPFSRIIFNRMTYFIVSILRKEQDDFRKERSGTDILNTLRIITEQPIEKQSPTQLSALI